MPSVFHVCSFLLVNQAFASVADSVERLNKRAYLVLKSLGFPNVIVACSRR